MRVYVYQAALLCEDCGELVKQSLLHDEFGDSDYYPQGPYSDGGGAADTPQHCDHCERFLENPLTDDGRDYVRAAADGACADQWRAFYGLGRDDNDDIN